MKIVVNGDDGTNIKLPIPSKLILNRVVVGFGLKHLKKLESIFPKRKR